MNIETLWAAYEAEVIAPDAGAEQRAETRLAFYGGAATAFQLVKHGMAEGLIASLAAFEAEIEAASARVTQ